jgi:hypothetical protein
MKPQTFQEGMCLAVEFYTGKIGGKDGYELLSPWLIAELMECWLPYK